MRQRKSRESGKWGEEEWKKEGEEGRKEDRGRRKREGGRSEEGEKGSGKE